MICRPATCVGRDLDEVQIGLQGQSKCVLDANDPHLLAPGADGRTSGTWIRSLIRASALMALLIVSVHAFATTSVAAHPSSGARFFLTGRVNRKAHGGCPGPSSSPVGESNLRSSQTPEGGDHQTTCRRRMVGDRAPLERRNPLRNEFHSRPTLPDPPRPQTGARTTESCRPWDSGSHDHRPANLCRPGRRELLDEHIDAREVEIIDLADVSAQEVIFGQSSC